MSVLHTVAIIIINAFNTAGKQSNSMTADTDGLIKKEETNYSHKI